MHGGGNAVDAALAAALVLTVVYPHNTSLGGDLIALVRETDGTIKCVNSSGPASRNVDPDDYRARYGERMPVVGAETITVPGALAGLSALHQLGASRPWAEHFARAKELALDGAVVSPGLGAALEENRVGVLEDPGLSAVMAPGSHLLHEGDRFVQESLARSLSLLASGGPESLYGGELGRRLISGLSARGSSLDIEDLAAFQPRVEEPIHGRFGVWDLWTSGPNTQGFVLLEILGALEALGGHRDPLGRDAGILSELFRRGAIDRELFLGEPEAMKSTVIDLLKHDRLATLGREAASSALSRVNENHLGHSRPKGDTVAVVTADGEGRAVSLIQSVFHSFGAGILEPSTGFVMHNRGSFFSLSSDSPNQLLPGRRPAHTLMPVMVTQQGELAWVLGTMGGKAQPQILAQVLLRLFTGEDATSAVWAPRWIVGGLEVDQPSEMVLVESSVNSSVKRILSSQLPLTSLPDHDENVGHAQVIAVLHDKALVAASDPRADGAEPVPRSAR